MPTRATKEEESVVRMANSTDNTEIIDQIGKLNRLQAHHGQRLTAAERQLSQNTIRRVPRSAMQGAALHAELTKAKTRLMKEATISTINEKDGGLDVQMKAMGSDLTHTHVSLVRKILKEAGDSLKTVPPPTISRNTTRTTCIAVLKTIGQLAAKPAKMKMRLAEGPNTVKLEAQLKRHDEDRRPTWMKRSDY